MQKLSLTADVSHTGQYCAFNNAHLVALGLVSMMLRHVTVKTVALISHIGMHRRGCSGETRFVLHVPSSS